MERKKFDILNVFLDKIIFGFFIGLLSLTLNFAFSQNSFAEYKATLSASVNETTASINGTEIIESSDETAEHEINLKINTTNKTGYTATFSSKTDETALLNTNPAINTKIDSISSNYALANFSANTWGYRFDDMTDVTKIKFSDKFDTSNVTNMGRMFSRMKSIQQLDLSHFNTGNVTAMNDMFSLMTSLMQINFGANFDTSNVTDMTGMFYQSTSLVNLDLSHFNTRKVKSMISMFSQMSGLTILDISNFETPSLENAGSMFAIDPGFSDNLEKIYVNQDFDTSKLISSTNAFIRRNRLRGGNGSYLSDPSTADKTWLRVDRPGVQGYFTRKP